MTANSRPKDTPPRPFRVALYTAEDVGDWLDPLVPGGPFEVTRCATARDLAESGADLAVAWVPVAETAPLAAELAAEEGAPPLTLLSGKAAAEHPQARFMRALLQAKREWETAFDALLDPLAILDQAGRVVRANLGFAEAFGHDIRAVKGLVATELLGVAEEGLDLVSLSLRDGEPRAGEVRYAGLGAPFQVSLSPLRDEEGAFRGVVLLLKDLSEIKESRERLLQAARLADVGHLAAGVAHEINTPLASIALRAESLQKAAQDEALRAVPAFSLFPRYLRTIEEEVFRCKKIIRALLEFSARRNPETKPLDLNALVERTADLVQHQFRVQQVTLDLRLGEGLAPVPADEGQIRQVLVALLTNALDVSKAGGRVTVSTAGEDGGRVRLAVEDDGPGIPRELQDRIFSPFFTTKPFGQGTGLGLSICHGIVAAHGGVIRVDSEPGRGTRMSVALPVLCQEVAS